MRRDGKRSPAALVLGCSFLLSMTAPVTAEVLRVKAGATGAGNGTSWANAFPELRTALTAAQFDDEIWVAAGVYKPTGFSDRGATFSIPVGVRVFGGFVGTETTRNQRNPDPESNGTILSGDLAGNGENSWHVVSLFDPGTAVLDGVTITAGNANDEFPHDAGGGIIVVDRNLTLANCTIRNNATGGPGIDGFGGGLFIEGGETTITDCAFRDNLAHSSSGGGGGLQVFGGDVAATRCSFVRNVALLGRGGAALGERGTLVFDDSRFEANTAVLGGAIANGLLNEIILRDCMILENEATDGGGLHSRQSRPGTGQLIRCTFAQNRATGNGGGIYSKSSEPLIDRCRFLGNTAGDEGGGIYGTGASSQMMNSLFSGNVAGGRGGAVLNCTSEPRVTNCTFTGNIAGTQGGGMLNTGNSSPTLANCILWDNADENGVGATGQMMTDDVGVNRPVVNFTCIAGGWTGLGGAGIITDDPMFRRAPDDGGDGFGIGDNDDFGDLRLRAGSPCIDTGDNDALTGLGVTTDLNGDPRFVDDPDAPDLGNGSAPLVDMGAFERDPTATVPGDFDDDGDTDLADFLFLIACYQGAGVPVPPDCAAADFDGDKDVDLSDTVEFQALLTGSK